jgi:hypothetical protein
VLHQRRGDSVEVDDATDSRLGRDTLIRLDSGRRQLPVPIAMLANRMRRTRLSLVSIVAFSQVITMSGQAITMQPDLLAGRWEVTDPSGVHGILVMIDSHADSPIARQTRTITRQTVQVRVYHRENGQDTRQSYVVFPPRYAAAEFDGRRIRVPGLTALFDPDASRWTGTWSRNGQTADVVLERPHPATGVTPNPFVGEWDGLPDGRADLPSLRIHIVQSFDGVLTAWMDRKGVVQNNTSGISLAVVSVDPMNVVLGNESPVANVYDRFTEVLSHDGNSMIGNWNDRPTARQTFHRIQ